MLLEFGDALSNEGGLLDGPIGRLRRHDHDRGTVLAETVAAWLDNLGNVLAASATVGVHPSTFRYRLQRAVEISRLNLDDPDQRFAAMVECRLVRGDAGAPAQLPTRGR